MADLRTLLGRLEAVKTPDRTLFWELLCDLVESSRADLSDSKTGALFCTAGRLLDAGAWTDFALALVERLLPGWRCLSGQDSDCAEGQCVASLFPSGSLGRTAYGPSVSLAILRVLLTVLIAEAPSLESIRNG